MSRKIYYVIIIFAALFIGAVGFAATRTVNSDDSQPQPVAAPASGSVQVSEEWIDLGELSVEDEGMAEFTVTNTSEQPLTLSSVGTSCMCTLAEIEIDGQKSPEFNMEMHNTADMKNWQGVIAPNGQAIVRMTYIPKLMPVEGEITRSVTFDTSDPHRSEVELTVRAFVVQ